MLEQYLKRISENKIKPKVLQELFIKLKDISQLPDPEKDYQILRLAIIAEMDAVNLYESMAKLTSNENIKKVMLDVAQEEKVHFGEFETLLAELDEEHEPAVEEAEEEIEELIEN